MAEINNHREFFEALLAGETVENVPGSYSNGFWRLSESGMLEVGRGWQRVPERLDILRIKKKTLRIGAFDVPEPVRKPLEAGTKYYVPKPHSEPLVDYYKWVGDGVDHTLVQRGLAHLSEEAAELHAKALLSFTARPESGDSK